MFSSILFLIKSAAAFDDCLDSQRREKPLLRSLGIYKSLVARAGTKTKTKNKTKQKQRGTQHREKIKTVTCTSRRRARCRVAFHARIPKMFAIGISRGKLIFYVTWSFPFFGGLCWSNKSAGKRINHHQVKGRPPTTKKKIYISKMMWTARLHRGNCFWICGVKLGRCRVPFAASVRARDENRRRTRSLLLCSYKGKKGWVSATSFGHGQLVIVGLFTASSGTDTPPPPSPMFITQQLHMRSFNSNYH